MPQHVAMGCWTYGHFHPFSLFKKNPTQLLAKAESVVLITRAARDPLAAREPDASVHGDCQGRFSPSMSTTGEMTSVTLWAQSPSITCFIPIGLIQGGAGSLPKPPLK